MSTTQITAPTPTNYERYEGNYRAYQAARHGHSIPSSQALSDYSRHVAMAHKVEARPPRPSYRVAAVVLLRRMAEIMRISRPNDTLEQCTPTVDTDNALVLRALTMYMLGDKRFETENFEALRLHGQSPYTLQKGIALCGLTGTGKTLPMKAIADSPVVSMSCTWPPHQYRSLAEINTRGWNDCYRFSGFFLADMHNCITIEHAYRQHGDKAIARYHTLPRTMVFDDFGTESTETMNYGNRRNIMEEIITSRYHLFTEQGVKTHITTNLMNGDEIEKMYGTRTRERLREMFNFIYLPGKVSRRK